MTRPCFGKKEDAVDYTTRLGVYAVIPDATNQKIVLVQAPNGAWFLPGGEIEAGEDHKSALERELLEELGFTAQLGSYYGQADEYFYSRHRDTHFYNPAFIYQVTHYKEVSKPLEDFNQLAWWDLDQALTLLKRDSHRWGVEQWIKQVAPSHQACYHVAKD